MSTIRWLFLLFLVLAVAPGWSAESREKPRQVLNVLVPREEFANLVTTRGPTGRLLPLSELRALMDRDLARRREKEKEATARTAEAEQQFPRELVVRRMSAELQVAAEMRFARLDVKYELDVHSAQDQRLAVPKAGAFVEKASLDGKDVLLELPGDAQSASIVVAGKGAHTLAYTLIVPVVPDGYSQQVSVNLPPFPSGQLTARFAAGDLEVAVEPGVDVLRVHEGKSTRVTAGLSSAQTLKVSWYTVARHGAEASAGDKATAPQQRGHPLVYAESCHVVGISETGLVGLVDYRFTVYRSPVSAISIKLPAGIGPVEVLAASDLVSRKDTGKGENGMQEVVFTTPQEGEIRFALRYKQEFPQDASDWKCDVGEFIPQAVEADTGYMVVSRLANVEVRTVPGEALSSLENTPLPAHFARHAGEDSLFSFKYQRHPAQLGLQVVRYQDAPVLTAVVTKAVAATVFAPAGFRVTRVCYQISNQRREFLKLVLNPEEKLERVFVDGRAVVHSQDATGHWLIPIRPPSAAQATSMQVVVVYRTPGEGLASKSGVSATLPAIDLPILKLSWRWQVPTDTVLFGFNSGAHSLRASRQPSRAENYEFVDPIQGSQDLKAYFLYDGLVPTGTHPSIAARRLPLLLEWISMVFFFVLGGAVVTLVLRLLCYGYLPRTTLAALALSFLGTVVLAEEQEIFQPFTGGANVMGWVIFTALLFRLTLYTYENFRIPQWARPRPAPPPREPEPVATTGTPDAKTPEGGQQ
jgi:hypothetical protein